MKQIIKKLIPFLLILVSVISCKKGFINDIKPTNSASSADVYANAAGVRVFFNGIYRNLRSQWQSTDGAAGGTTDTWGYSAVFLAREAKGKDVVMPVNNWYYFDYQNANREPTYRRVRFTWYFYYEFINQLNVLIDGTTKSTGIDDADKNTLIAEARALRGYLYFELIREFQLPYLKDATAPGVPIYTQPSTDTTKGNPRGTVQDVYDQINSDLAFAVANIGSDQLLKDQININVAWGMLARIDLEQGKWADAETAAANAIQGHALDADNYYNNYHDQSSSEILWSLPQTVEDGGQTLYYGTPSAFFTQTGNSYDAFFVSEEFVNTFSATDVRNTFWFYDDPGTPDEFVTNKLGTIDGNSYSVDFVNGSSGQCTSTDFNEPLNMMRVGEMYLIEAEAKAEQGEADAGAVLFELQKNRDPKAKPSGNTGTNLLNEIYLERRKELYGELGISWTDAKRLQAPIDRTTSNHPAPYNYIIPANDPRFNLKIPQQEMQANKSLFAGDQNP